MNHGDDEEDERDIKRALERRGDAHIKVEIQSNSEFQSLTSIPTWSLGSPRFQIDVHDAYEIGFGRSTYAQREDEINFLMALILGAETISISGVQLVQELSTLKLMFRSHTTSNWTFLDSMEI
jgi:hypothetical protein